MTNKKILLLTLVHPDFLPPVYAVGQVLRDLGYSIHILTFDSYVPAELDLGDNIELESLGKHHGIGTLQRLKLRRQFKNRAKQIVSKNPAAVIAFCPFSFRTGLKVKNNTPFLYIALEIADFRMSIFLKSPLSGFRNLQVLRSVHKADLVSTPSIQRSAWLAGRCHLGFMPYTILNTAYLPRQNEPDTYEQFKEIVPADFLSKKIILYTGAVNTDLCTMELVQAFEMVNDEQSALIVTGVKDNAYSNGIRDFVLKSKAANRIKLFPYLTRAQMLALQANAHIGVCLTKEYQNNVKSKMIAPNKVGEYAAKKLYLLGIKNEYLKPFELKGIASLADSPSPADVSKAIIHALQAVGDPGCKARIADFVSSYFCMQQQLKPVIEYLNKKSQTLQ